MLDYFELLGELRRPWIDPDRLNEQFLALSTTEHPDRFHGASEAEKDAANRRFAELNAAYHILRDPKERLRHLLELELGTPVKNVERVPSDGMELGFQVGRVCREVDRSMEAKAKVDSPMLSVRWTEESLVWMDKLTDLQKTTLTRRDQALDELRTMNAHWESAPSTGDAAQPNTLPLDRLEELYRILAYLSRWTDQIQARLIRLSISGTS